MPSVSGSDERRSRWLRWRVTWSGLLDDRGRSRRNASRQVHGVGASGSSGRHVAGRPCSSGSVAHPPAAVADRRHRSQGRRSMKPYSSPAPPVAIPRPAQPRARVPELIERGAQIAERLGVGRATIPYSSSILDTLSSIGRRNEPNGRPSCENDGPTVAASLGLASRSAPEGPPGSYHRPRSGRAERDDLLLTTTRRSAAEEVRRSA